MFVTHGNGLMITAIFWGAIVLIVFFSNFFGYRERVSRHRAIEKLADKGQPIPPELLGGNGRRDFYDSGYRGWHRYSLSGGIYMMGIGIALFIFLWAMTTGDFNNMFGGDSDMHWSGPGWLPFVAIFPFMIGLSRVLAFFFDRPPPPPT
jgi:hypothetical protein